MGFSVGIGPVRVSRRGISAGVGIGPVSYGKFMPWGGRSYSGGRGGGGGTRTIYVERLTAKEIREAAEEEARQDAARIKRRKAERAERERERDEREREYEHRREERDRQWATEEAERERAERERKDEERAKDMRELREEAESWVRLARLQDHTHVELFLCFGIGNDGDVVVPVEDVIDFVVGLCPEGGWGDNEPRMCMMDSFQKGTSP